MTGISVLKRFAVGEEISRGDKTVGVEIGNVFATRGSFTDYFRCLYFDLFAMGGVSHMGLEFFDYIILF